MNPVIVKRVLFVLQRGHRHIIGYYDSDRSDEFRNFKKIAGKLRDDCKFHAAFG